MLFEATTQMQSLADCESLMVESADRVSLNADDVDELLAEFVTNLEWSGNSSKSTNAATDDDQKVDDTADSEVSSVVGSVSTAAPYFTQQELVCVKRKTLFGKVAEIRMRMLTMSVSDYLAKHRSRSSLLERCISQLTVAATALLSLSYRPRMIKYSHYSDTLAQTPSEPMRKRTLSRPISISSVNRLSAPAVLDSNLNWHEICNVDVLRTYSKMDVQRQDAIYEFISTERDYITDMTMLVDTFLKPMRALGILSAKEIESLFSNLEMLVPVNQAMLRTLEERVGANHVVDCVGDVMLRMADYFKIYAFYCSNYTSAQMFLQNHSARTFQSFVEDQQKNSALRNLTLGCFLIKPVQRICKYPLLLREIRKATPVDHSDYALLQETIVKLETVLGVVNKGAAMAENVHRVVQKLDIIEPSRRLIKEGALLCVQTDSAGTTTSKPVHVFLFNDLIIIARKRRQKFYIVRLSRLENVLFISLTSGAGNDQMPPSSISHTAMSFSSKASSTCNFDATSAKAFQLLCDGRGKFTFHVPTALEYIDWVDNLKRYLLHSRKTSGFVTSSIGKQRPSSTSFVAPPASANRISVLSRSGNKHSCNRFSDIDLKVPDLQKIRYSLNPVPNNSMPRTKRETLIELCRPASLISNDSRISTSSTISNASSKSLKKSAKDLQNRLRISGGTTTNSMLSHQLAAASRNSSPSVAEIVDSEIIAAPRERKSSMRNKVPGAKSPKSFRAGLSHLLKSHRRRQLRKVSSPVSSSVSVTATLSPAEKMVDVSQQSLNNVAGAKESLIEHLNEKTGSIRHLVELYNK